MVQTISKAQADYLQQLAYAEKKGIEQGEKRGIEKGIGQGIQRAVDKLMREGLLKGYTREELMRILDRK